MNFLQQTTKRFTLLMVRFLLLIAFLAIAGRPFAQNLPARPDPPRLVNDFANVLNADQKGLLEQKLVALDDSTSNQIAIVTLKNLDGYDISDYATKLFRAWGIGDKKNNNGVLVLVSVEERKIWIATGYGLEGAIPDVTASDIIAHKILPDFKQGNYYLGLDKGVDALSLAAAGEYHIARERKDDSNGGAGALIFFIILVVVILIVIKSRGGGGGGGNYYSRRGSDFLTGAILGNLLGGGGGSSSSGWGGSSGGGGGFGGFGGGSSGGGGAGGSW